MLTSDERLRNQAMTWHTPHGMGGMDAQGKRGGAGGGEFAKQANNWSTPMAQESEDAGSVNANMTSLTAQTKLWRTPSAGDDTRGVHPTPDTKAGEYSLTNQTAKWTDE